MMKIAVIVPALVNQGPVTVARDIISGMLDKKEVDIEFTVFYFDKNKEITFPCRSIHIGLNESIDFSEYDIIHSHMLRPDYFVWKNRKKLRDIYKISTLHQNIVANLTASYNVVVAKIVSFFWINFLKCFDKVITLSDVMKDVYKDKVSDEKILTIYNGRESVIISKKQIDIEDELVIEKLKQKYIIIGVVALLTKRKGIHQLIEALIDLPNYALVIVGNGQEMDKLIEQSKKAGVFSRCYFTGYKNNGKDYMSYFDIFAMTSYSEGFPLSVLEVSQLRKPVVCSDIPLFKEIFTKEDVSFFKLDNIESLRNAITHSVLNKDFFGYNLYNTVNSKYSYDSMIFSYMDLYKQAILKK